MYLNKGVLYMLLATFTFTAMNVFVKMLPHIPVIEIIFFRSVVSLLLSVYFLRRQRVPIFGHKIYWLMGRGISGAIALILYFTLLQQIPLATASTLNYLAPIFTVVLSLFILKERVAFFRWGFFLISFIGVLVVEGFDHRISMTHLVLGISSSFFMGLAYTFIRVLKTDEHPLVIIFYFPLVVLPISGVWSFFSWVTPSLFEWFILLVIGILTQIAQLFMTKAYQIGDVNKVSIIAYTGLIFSLFFGFVFFKETFSLFAYLGMLLVILGVALSVIFKG